MHYTSRKVYEYISTVSNDPIVQWRTCRVSGKEFAIYQSDINYYKKISPVLDGEIMLIPIPTLCPEERQLRRLSHRNERNLYKRTCDFSGKTIISMYHPESTYVVYGHEARWSDKRSGGDFAQERNDSLSFFDQFSRLKSHVPLLSQTILQPKNSAYTNYGYQNKDCYLTFASDLNDECIHCSYVRESESCIDCFNVRTSRVCYELIDCVNCYQCLYSKGLDSCSSCQFCVNCKNCTDCIGAVNIVGGKYIRWGKQLSEDEYKKRKKSLTHASIAKFNKRIAQMEQESIHPATVTVQSESCHGHGIVNAKDCHFCYDVSSISGSKYIQNVPRDVHRCMDVDGAGMLTLGYESMSLGGSGSYKCAFCINVWEGASECYYCELCVNCSHCFGCIGLKHKQYCVFNMQYTEQEYSTLVKKIINKMKDKGERGELFPISSSQFGYNESVAQERVPLTKEQATSKNFMRSDIEYHINVPSGIDTISSDKLPDIGNTAVLKKAVICTKSKKPRRFIQKEFDIYARLGIPLPQRHPELRHTERIKKRTPKELHLRTCDKTGEQILSVYPQDAPFKVYSEEAYKQEVYG